jgi:virginiamycin B lyase
MNRVSMLVALVLVAGIACAGEITEFALPTDGHRPQAIVTGPDGNLWVTEVIKHEIVRVTPSGEITEFPVTGKDVGVLQGIAAGPDGNIWFTSREENSVRRMTVKGDFNGEFKLPSAVPGKSGMAGPWPREIIAGPDGNLWFAEMAANNIARITPKGEITEFKIPTADAKPYSLTIGPDKNIWFTEWTQAKIGHITMDGKITELPVKNGGREIACGADGNLWFTADKANAIGRLTPKGENTEFPIPTAASQPLGITAGSDGNIYFCEFKAGKVGCITPDGKITETAIPAANSQPFCITSGPDGNIWIALQANRVARLVIPGAKAVANTPAKQAVAK